MDRLRIVVSGEWTVGVTLVRRLAEHGIEISSCAPDELDGHLSGDRAGAVVVDGRGGLEQLIEVIGRLAGPTLPPDVLVGLDGGPAGEAAGRKGSSAETTNPENTDLANSDLVVGPISLSPSALRVTVHGRSAQLRPKEVELLSFFLTHPDQVFSRSELMDSVWGYDIGDPSTVAVQVRRIREKIEKDPANPSILVTVWGAGYRLDVPEGATSPEPAEAGVPAPVRDPGDDRRAEGRTASSRRPRRKRDPQPPQPPVPVAEQVAPAQSSGPTPGDPVTQPSLGSPRVAAEQRSRPPGRSAALLPELRTDGPGEPRWDGAVELARTRVYDALARLRRRRASVRVDPKVWAMIEAFASLRLDGFDVAFDPVDALVQGDEPSGSVMERYLDALEAAAQPFADGRDEHAALDPTAPQPLEPLVALDMLCHGDPTMFGRAMTLDEFVEAVARFEIAPAIAGPVPRTVRVALSTWAQRAGRLDTPIAMSLGLVTTTASAVPATLEQRRHSLLLALGRGAELMDRAEQHVRRLRDLYVEETAASSSLKVIDLIDLFTAMPMLTVEHAAEQLAVSHQTVRNNVRRFEQMGWLVEVGRFGRGGRKYWYAREVVEAIMLTIADPMQRLCAPDLVVGRHTGLDPTMPRPAAV